MTSSSRVRPGVFIYRPVDASGESHAELARAGCDVTVGDGRSISEQPAPRHDVHALLGATHAGLLDREVLERWPSLRIVAKYTIGTDDVDVDAATELGILVTHAPTEANWGGVAEGTMALMLAMLKRVPARDHAVKAGGWRDPALEGVYLGAREDGYAGITVGIIGLGRIGRRLAELLRPWRLRIIASDPYVDDDVFAHHGVARVGLETLLGQADVVTVHCNLTAETRNLIDADRLARLRPGAVLINTARGAIVDLAAVCDAFDAGRLASAALDVFAEEPLPDDHRLRRYGERVIFSPHMVAANRGGTLAAAVPWATSAVLAALGGAVPRHVYNEAAIDRWQQRFGGRSLLSRP